METVGKSLLTFELSVSDVDQEVYADTRIQLHTHPEEPLDYTIACVLAYCHCLQFSPSFGPRWYDLKQVTLTAVDVSEQTTLWAQVGGVHKKSSKIIQRLKGIPNVRFYFFSQEQIDQFCQLMRGSKVNWIDSYQFYYFPERLIEQIAQIGLKRRNTWQVHMVESVLYLAIEDVNIESELERVAMWSRYQETINSSPLPTATTN